MVEVRFIIIIYHFTIIINIIIIIIGVINLSYAISDVRDVARFHIAAMEQPTAVGRYICANNAISLQKILQVR